MAAASPMSLKDARDTLGVAGDATPGELRRAFREAAKLAHPDRPGGDAERFRQVVAAYHRLSAPPPARVFQPPAPRRAAPAALRIDVRVACRGGVVDYADDSGGQPLRIALPPGLRSGDVVRAGGLELRVLVCGSSSVLVQGNDLWMSAQAPAEVLERGGPLPIETPQGARVVRIPSGARRLVRVRGGGLPAQGGHPQGDLFLRLAPAAAPDAAALLRRFTQAWAA